MSENTKTLANTGAINLRKAKAAQCLPLLQSAYIQLQMAAPKISLREFCDFIKGNRTETDIRHLVATINIGNTPRQVGGVEVDTKLFEQSIIIENLAAIKHVLSELDKKADISGTLKYLSVNSGVLNIDELAIEKDHTRILSRDETEYYTAVRDIVNALNAFNKTYHHKGLSLFKKHTDINESSEYGQTITLKDETFMNLQ